MHRALAAVAPTLLLLLAGCSSAPADQPDAMPSTATSTGFVSTVPAPAPPPTLTDTLHFLDAPHLTGRPPTGDEPMRMALPSNLPGPTLTYSLPRPAGLGVLHAQVHLFVDVQGTLPNTGASGCFWYATLIVPKDASTDYVDPMCLPEGPVVGPGLHELTFSNTGWDIRQMPSDVVRVQLSIDSVPPPGASATLLTAARDLDSTVTILDLQLPLDTTTLL